ncbi:MAG: class I poly(R)-hydroxyalkanoic acid synthase [Pseudomonadota bacterium]
MATQDTVDTRNFEKISANLERVEALTQRLMETLSHRSPPNLELNGPGQDLYTAAMSSYWQSMLENPGKIYEQQLEYWGKSVRHFIEAQQALVVGDAQPSDEEEDTLSNDRRFDNPLWRSNPYFRYVKQQYALNKQALEQVVKETQSIDEKDKKRLEFFTRQIIDMMSPTNFLGTNPDALEKAIETEGESLVKGLENLVADMEANNGEMVVRLCDEKAFSLGDNIAVTEGEVVYRNSIMELLQYTPTTEKVHKTPVVIFPPWINKYYILDLKRENSLIGWLVDQGYTVFVVSWVNPDASHADVGMDDYIQHGYLGAIEEVKAITGEPQLNAVGYCIAGTTLHITLALMQKRGDKSIKSATFFTALTDFSDQGEFVPFLQKDFVEGIQKEVDEQGVLRSFIMGRTMSFLRSNDLIYKPAIRSYMMGETPPAFDLLYWNGDGANLPARMVMEYLRDLCQDNAFVTDGLSILGETVHVNDVQVPIMAVTCETDHIAAWKDCYRGFLQTGSRDKSFIVSESGHIAGIVNPPSKNKYGYYSNTDLPDDADDWIASATERKGSWWPTWESWLRKRSGKKVAARTPGGKSHKSLGSAPGTYVRRKASL